MPPTRSRHREEGDRSSIRARADSAARGCSAGHTGVMGFDPTRKHKRTRFDYVYVAASVVVCVAVVIWALLG